jgi:hypothetical protein
VATTPAFDARFQMTGDCLAILLSIIPNRRPNGHCGAIGLCHFFEIR